MIANLLYPIADALQMPLKYSATTKQVSGELNAVWELNPGVPVTFDMKVMYSLVNKDKEQVGVLVKVKGDLLALVTYNKPRQALAVFLISKSKLSGYDISFDSKCTIKEVVGILRPGIVKSYSRHKAGTNWEQFKLPDEG